MASKRRIRRNMCLGKKRHASKENALIARWRMILMHGKENIVGVYPYKCQFCGMWHLGHESGRIRRAKQEHAESYT